MLRKVNTKNLIWGKSTGDRPSLLALSSPVTCALLRMDILQKYAVPIFYTLKQSRNIAKLIENAILPLGIFRWMVNDSFASFFSSEIFSFFFLSFPLNVKMNFCFANWFSLDWWQLGTFRWFDSYNNKHQMEKPKFAPTKRFWSDCQHPHFLAQLTTYKNFETHFPKIPTIKYDG